MSYAFRVFVSYAHRDKPLVEQIVAHLEGLGLRVLWDRDINPTKRFTDEIKELIARSHVFLPIITEHSNERPWVHQETGFAIALNIPVLPICVGSLPSELIAETQGISVQADLADFAEKIQSINFQQIVLPKPNKPFGTVEVAEWAEARAEYIARYSNWILELGEYGRVRLQARFSSFAIPDEDIHHPIWDEREGTATRSDHLRYLQREERKILERHARMAGCRLLIDPAAHIFEVQGRLARQARVKVLLDFIKTMPPDKIEIAISPRAQDTSLIIVEDYFFAESMAARPTGYVHTVFNSHPPTVLQRVMRFDQLFYEASSQADHSLESIKVTLENLLQEA